MQSILFIQHASDADNPAQSAYRTRLDCILPINVNTNIGTIVYVIMGNPRVYKLEKFKGTNAKMSKPHTYSQHLHVYVTPIILL